MELDKDSAIFEISTPDEWVGKTVGDLDIRKNLDLNVLGIKKNGKLDLKITPETTFSADEDLLVLGNNHDIQKLFHE